MIHIIYKLAPVGCRVKKSFTLLELLIAKANPVDKTIIIDGKLYDLISFEESFADQELSGLVASKENAELVAETKVTTDQNPQA